MMLNNSMQNNNTDPRSVEPNKLPVSKKPDESAGFAVEGFVKIFDPQTQETIVETRA